ncbi:hypothetical protein [Sphingobacterium sp. UBA5996]|nr:hypothetical protein [Sphingobacterium sp. UBA5996]
MTTIGGWIIVNKGVAYTPWLTLVFGALAYFMVLFRGYLEKKEAKK